MAEDEILLGGYLTEVVGEMESQMRGMAENKKKKGNFKVSFDILSTRLVDPFRLQK